MAYALHYICGYTNIEGNNGRVAIYEDGYGGGTETLTTKANSVQVRYAWGGWDEPIIGLTASFSIVNDESDFFTLLPLMTAEERKYLVIIEELEKAPNKIYFQGFLNCEDVEQKYLQSQEIRLNASGYLSKLQHIKPTTIETLENDTFINIILSCLNELSVFPSGFGVRVNCSLFPNGTTLASGQTLFNKCGVYKEAFWKNNIDRDSSLEIIKKILTAFDCYLYWYNDYYYIERYADIWNTSPTFITYVSGTEYWPTDTGSVNNPTKTITDFVDLVKLDTRQNISIIPGQKEVEINIEQQLLFNLVVNNFENATYTSDDLPITSPRQWELYEESSSFGTPAWRYLGLPFKNIAKALNRYLWYGTKPNIEFYRGMYTSFKISATYDTVMTISFKWGTEFTPFPYGDPDEYNVDFYWSLAVDEFGFNYLIYDDSTDSWSVEFVSSGSPEDALNITTIPGTEFDLANFTCKVEITIPFSSFMLASGSPYEGDRLYTFGIGTEYRRLDWPPTNDNPHGNCYYGDVSIVVNSPLDDNYVSGVEANTAFLNKKTLTQHFCDASNVSLRNAIWYGGETTATPDALDEKTETWVDDYSSSAEGLDLAELKIKDKFRLYNVSRQKLTTKIKAGENFYSPLSLFEDSNQQDSTGDDKPHFVLVGYTYDVQSDQMDIILSEYDNEEDVNLT
jgi:hypothetical protein